MPNIYNDILWQTLLGGNEVEICLQPTDTELPTDIYQPTNSSSNSGMYSFIGEKLLYELMSPSLTQSVTKTYQRKCMDFLEYIGGRIVHKCSEKVSRVGRQAGVGNFSRLKCVFSVL